MGIGVVADLNRTRPDEYGDSHPLNAMSNYRPNSESYVFTKICGNADLNGDNNFNHSLIYETIADPSFVDPIYRDITINGGIDLEESVLGEINLKVDLKKVFVKSAVSYIDIQTNNLVFSDEEIMAYIANNFQNAISLE